MNDTTIHLISGVEFDYADPMACEAITEHDVAHALARISRYGGHCAGTWSVAQHCLLVTQLTLVWYKAPELALGALNHDDAEFVTGDWPTPMKQFIINQGVDFRRQVERPVEFALAKHLGLVIDDLHAGAVKNADNAAYEIEIAALKPNGHVSREALDDELMALGTRFLAMAIELDVAQVEASWLTVHRNLMEGDDA